MANPLTVTLSPSAVEALEQIGRSLGGKTVEEALAQAIGTQAEISHQVGQGNAVTIRDNIAKITVSR